jgi:hypothetical protein
MTASTEGQDVSACATRYRFGSDANVAAATYSVALWRAMARPDPVSRPSRRDGAMARPDPVSSPLAATYLRTSWRSATMPLW